MGTLCKNCPLKNIHQETGEVCTIAFVRKFGNSCVNLDVAEHLFEKEFNKLSEEKKEQIDQLAKDMAEYQMEKEKKSSTKKSAPKKASTPKKNGNGKGRSGKKDSVRVQEVCETA
jgi:histidinol dehydrogenase